MALSLGAEGIDYLEPGEWQTFLSYRYLNSDRGYVGTEEFPGYDETFGVQLEVHSFDVNLTRALTRRFSLSLTLPFMYGRVSSLIEHGGSRHATDSGGLGDIRLTANGWLFDPDTAHHGNVSLSLGVKAPTGDSKVRDNFNRGGGRERHAVDHSIQPGDGGWGVIAELQAFRRLFERTHGYLAGFYLANPRDRNNTRSQIPIYGDFRRISVPDQYEGRAGVSYALWPEQGLAVSLGGRIDGIARRDLFGKSEGFRRPGYSIYVEPGLSLAWGKTSASLFVPVGVAFNKQRSRLDERFGGNLPGSFADYLVLFSLSQRF